MSCPRCNAPVEEQTLREFGGVCPKCLLAFSEEQDAPAFPNLEIVEMIGQGGMGVVYKARQKNLDRIVALKVLSPQLSEDPEFVGRFTREAKALAQLSHPNIVAIHDSGIHDRVPYLVMEYIEGHPLRSLIASGKLTPARALEFVPQICDALQYAHAHGVVHRDIKPENILIDRQGRVKIADFGLAKLSKLGETQITQSGYVMGTPRYMAPEQFLPAGKVDHRADIYSLGVVFYEMLTGEVPMGRFKPPSARADVDRRLDPVVLKSLEREPEDRYQSAGEVKDQVAGIKPAPALPAGPRPPHPLKKAAMVIVLLALAAMGLGLLAGLLQVFTVAKLLCTVGAALLLASGVLWLLSFAFAHEAPRAPMRVSPGVSGCLVFLAAMLALVILAALLFLGGASKPAPLMPPPTPAPVVTAPAVKPPTPKGFAVDDLWPARESLPAGFEEAKSVEGAALLAKAGLPEAVLADVEYTRGLVFQDGRALMVGLQFKTELARLRWWNEPAFGKVFQTWQYNITGPGRGAILLRHDRSPIGQAAGLMLEMIVKKNLAEK